MTIQSLYITLLNPIVMRMVRIPERTKNILIQGSLYVLGIIFVLNSGRKLFPFVNQIGSPNWLIFGGILLGFIMLLSCKNGLYVLRVNMPFTILYVFSAVFILFTSFLHPIGFGLRGFALLMLTAFPVFYFVWENRGDRDLLYLYLSRALVVSGLLSCFLNLFMSFYDGGVFAEKMDHPNLLAMTLAGAMLGCLYLFIEAKGIPWRVLSIVTMILSLVLLSFTGSRTSILAVSGCVFITVIFVIRGVRSSNRKETVKKTKIVYLVVLVAICIFIGLLIFVSESDAVFSGRAFRGVDRLFALGGNLDSFSSGRFTIWKQYWEQLTVFGLNPYHNPIFLNGMATPGAHNAPLDFAFRSGIPLGISWLLMELIIVIFLLFLIFGKANRMQGALFIAMSLSTYLIYSMLELTYFPFTYSPFLCFYLALGPLMFKSPKRRKNPVPEVPV
jgi:O-antigen ligase